MRFLWSFFIAGLAMFLIIASMRAAAKNAIAAYRNRDDDFLLEHWTISAAMNVAWALWVAAAYVSIAVIADGAFDG